MPSPHRLTVRRRSVVIGALIGVGISGVTLARGKHGDTATPLNDPGPFTAPLDADGRPTRFRIVPDDYHVPYAGVAEDGRLFFLSDELFNQELDGASYIGLFLWKPDGTFDQLKVDRVGRPEGLPPGQAGPAGSGDAKALLRARLDELGVYDRRPISVAPFTRVVDGVTFGWELQEFEGTLSLTIAPGDFIAYYEPWDGLEYDT
jgi:hypothetical protein